MNALTWLEPLRTSVPELGPASWAALERLDADLQELCATAPPAGNTVAWSQWLLGLRHDLADRGHHAPPGSAGRGGKWLLNGEKCWVSRLSEAAGFVVFVRDPDQAISAVLVAADDPRVDREVIEPFGLGGWDWGVLRLRDLLVDPATALLGTPGSGLAIFHQHFAGFRPLVTAAALGTAAGVHGLVSDTLAARRGIGILPRIRDSALITLGRTHATITAGLLAALTTTRLAAAGHPDANLLARLGKAAGVDTAVAAVGDLAPLIGASGFQRRHPVAKARADLTGLLYADGIHDSLYRSGGITLLTPTTARPPMSALAPAA